MMEKLSEHGGLVHLQLLFQTELTKFTRVTAHVVDLDGRTVFSRHHMESVA